MAESSIGAGQFGVGSQHDYQQLRSNLTTATKKTSGVDSLAQLKKDRQDTITSMSGVDHRPTLPNASSKNMEGLMALAEAFASIFKAQGEVSETAVEGLAQSNNLSNIQSKSVMSSTEISIQKNNEAYQKYQQAEAEANNPFMKDLGWILLGVMAVVMIATVVAGMATGGAADTLLPAEVSATTSVAGGATGAAAAGAEAGAEAGLEATMEISTEASSELTLGGDTSVLMTGATDVGSETTPEEVVSNVAEQAGKEGAEDVGEGASRAATAEGTADVTPGTETGAEQLAMTQETEAGTSAVEGAGGATQESATEGEEEGIEQASQKAEEQGLKKAAESGAKKGLSRGTKLALTITGTSFGSATGIVEGVYSLKVAAAYRALANVQRQTGRAAATMGFEQANFQFLQNASQQDSTYTQSAVQANVGVIQTYDTIIQNYQQAYTNLKQSMPA